MKTKRQFDNHGVITNSTNPDEIGKFRFQVNGATGYIGNPPATEDEMLLPAGFTLQSNGEVETPLQRQKQAKSNPRTMADDDDMLLPAGITLED